ncbi:MAG TPA: hypothetical protein VLW85_06845 [Myxococcales bacterium]|nr:hypothetical protein [Myxococcales bacterium]
MIEYEMDLVQARQDIGHMLIAACYADVRYVIRRYDKVVGFFGGVGDLERLHAYEKRTEPPKPAETAQPTDPIDELRQMYARGEPLPDPKTPEEKALQWKFFAEIGEQLLREAEGKG